MGGERGNIGNGDVVAALLELGKGGKEIRRGTWGGSKAIVQTEKKKRARKSVRTQHPPGRIGGKISCHAWPLPVGEKGGRPLREYNLFDRKGKRPRRRSGRERQRH